MAVEHSIDRRSAAAPHAAVCLLLCWMGGCAPLAVAPMGQGFAEIATAPDSLPETDRELRHDAVELVAYELAPDPSDGNLEFPERPSQPSGGYSIGEVLALARQNHPAVIATRRAIEQSRANIAVAGQATPPELVLDVDTPVHDQSGASSASARLTFPIGQRAQQDAQIRIAQAELATAIAEHQRTVRVTSDEVLSVTLQTIYLQQRLELDRRADEISRERKQLSDPELRDGDAAANLVDFATAHSAAQRAVGRVFETERDLAIARDTVAQWMGIDGSAGLEGHPSVVIDNSLQTESLALPALAEVVDAALSDSAELAAAQSATVAGWLTYQAARNELPAMEAGPRYDHRLGRRDDQVGLRFQTDLPNHRNVQAETTAAEVSAKSMEDRVQLVRHAVAAQAARDFRELQSIATQLESYRQDTFVDDQQRILAAAQNHQELTGQQRLQIEEAILDQQRDQLELEYRFAVIRSRLRLHAIAPGSIQ
ncbi:TolC family protein [Stieleria sp. TO1_6]|uniref:TolC family protein n=1 Tax=Stieleria tagensis TaxID=2956795 RepID=UPI00209B397F|nr:TolC family protein [Stieleria tagensis]MCO8125440.1 TolC family protein [Stieleria tagensis]